MADKGIESKAFDKLNELLKEVKELNNTQGATLSSVNCLNDELSNLNYKFGTAFPNSYAPISYRKHGYYNWNSQQTIIPNQHWKTLTVFISYCSAIERGENVPRPDMDEKIVVNENTRFPFTLEDELYIDVRSPVVLAEMLFIDEVLKNSANLKSRDGLTKHFLDYVKDEIYTRSSFEAKNKLIWIETQGLGHY